MRATEKALMDQVERQHRDLVNLFNAAVAATEKTPRPPSASEVRGMALQLAIDARGKGVRDATLVATARAFEDYLSGKPAS